MKKLIALTIIFICFSCEKKQPNFSKAMINKLIVKDNELPSYYLSIDLYVLTNNHEIHQTNNHYLFELYKRYYSKKFKSFSEFLDEILNKNFVLDKRLFKKIICLESFKLNPKIEKEYSELGFDKFLKKYSKDTTLNNGVLELNKSIIKTGEYSTIAYLFYKNRYDISEDCYIGKDYIRRREKSFK